MVFDRYTDSSTIVTGMRAECVSTECFSFLSEAESKVILLEWERCYRFKEKVDGVKVQSRSDKMNGLGTYDCLAALRTHSRS